jgi:hypothetical protein
VMVAVGVGEVGEENDCKTGVTSGRDPKFISSFSMPAIFIQEITNSLRRIISIWSGCSYRR